MIFPQVTNDYIFAFLGFTFHAQFAIIARLGVVLGIILLGFLLSRVLKNSVFPMFIRRAEKKDKKGIAILLKGFRGAVSVGVWSVGILIGLTFLPLASSVSVTTVPALLFAMRLVFILTTSAGFWLSHPLCDLIINNASEKYEFAQNQTIILMLSKTYKVLVVIFAVFALMHEFSFDVTTFIAGLGVVGLTVSLAAQDSASNLFAGALILIERPFNIGDWINVAGVEGTVEDITFRSTKIRALDNSLYVLPSSSVSGATINNGTNRTKRLYRFTLGVTYDSTRSQLEILMEDITTMLKGFEKADADSVTVRLLGFGDSSIDILVSSYLNVVDIPDFLALQNELHLNLMDIMEKNGASFAFPSTSVYLEKMPDNKQTEK